MSQNKENDIIIWTDPIETLKKQSFKSEQKIKYFCEECGNENVASFGHIKKKNERFLCRKCRLRDSLIKEYGSMEEFVRISNEKRNQTNLERFGTTNPNSLPEIRQKIEQTNLERYGYRDANQSPEIQQKKRETFLKNYGVDNPNKCPEVRDKIKKTNRERYGVDSYTQTEEYKEKTIATNRAKYGVDWTHQNKEIIEKGIQTTKERYGVDNVSQSEEIKKKKAETCRSHYGVDSPFQSKEVIEAYKRNNLEKHGVEWPQSLQEVKDKQAATNLKRYGTVSTAQAHYSEKAKEILFNKENLVEFMENEASKSVPIGADLLGISYSALSGYIKKYNLENFYLNQEIESKYEEELKDFLDSLEVNYISHNRNIINPLELDFYIPSKNVAIEFNGSYWHSDIHKSKDYHKTKSDLCYKQGIYLIHIFEYEWLSKKDIIKNYLKDILKDPIKIPARKCNIKEISSKEAELFLEENHLQGNLRSMIRIGLFYKKELVEVLTLSKPRFSKKYEWEITRFTSKFGYKIIGGFSKLLKYFKEKYFPKNIISYCNYSKFTGKSYQKLGFNKIYNSEPNYVWVNPSKDKILSRYQCTSRILKERGFVGKEEDIMRDLGFLRIYDSGNLVFLKEY